MDNLAYFTSVIALAFGAGLGLKGLLDPTWAGKLVRLQAENGQPEGFAEFRSTLGGMFLGLHLIALIYLGLVKGEAGVAACVILAGGWLFTAMGRVWAYQKDPNCKHQHVINSIIIEVVIGGLIAVWPVHELLRHIFG